jgi:hypothetical protein
LWVMMGVRDLPELSVLLWVMMGVRDLPEYWFLFFCCCLYCQALLLHIFPTVYIPFCLSVFVGVCVVQILKICFIENILVHTI